MGAAAALVVAQVAYLLAPVLPGIPAEPAATVAILLVCGVVLALAVPLGDIPALLVPALVGGAVVVVALEVAGADAAATPAEALTWGAAGAAFAIVFATPALVVALPLFVGLVALAFAGDPGTVTAAPGDALTLTLPAWGGGDPAGRLAAADVVFLGAFAVLIRRYALREAATTAGLATALLVAVLLGGVPTLTLLAAGALVPNADRLADLVRHERGGAPSPT